MDRERADWPFSAEGPPVKEEDTEIGLGDSIFFAAIFYVVACTVYATVDVAVWLATHVRIN